MIKDKSKKLSMIDKLSMLAFFNKNKDNPIILAEEYHKNPKKWEQLKSEYPDWEDYVRLYPELRRKLRNYGVPV